MRILRNIVVGSIFGGSALIIAFACVDRLDHPAPVRSAAPVAALTRLRPADPTVTGSLPAEAGPSIREILGRDAAGRDTAGRDLAGRDGGTREAARIAPARVPTPREAAAKIAAKVAAKPASKPPVKKTAEGFDTERLNALMRGDPAVTLARTR